MKQKGFTLIEIIIAIFLLSIAVVSVYSVFSAMVILTAGASDRLTSAYLAQEGIEIVRNIRDQNWVNSATTDTNWTDGLADASVDCSNGCTADYQTTEKMNPWLPDSTENYLFIDANGFYSSTASSKKTKFRRKITISCIQTDENGCATLKVISEVFWDVKPNILSAVATQQSVKVEETLYNWY